MRRERERRTKRQIKGEVRKAIGKGELEEDVEREYENALHTLLMLVPNLWISPGCEMVSLVSNTSCIILKQETARNESSDKIAVNTLHKPYQYLLFPMFKKLSESTDTFRNTFNKTSHS